MLQAFYLTRKSNQPLNNSCVSNIRRYLDRNLDRKVTKEIDPRNKKYQSTKEMDHRNKRYQSTKEIDHRKRSDAD